MPLIVDVSDKQIAKIAKRISKEQTSHSIVGLEVNKGVLEIENSSNLIKGVLGSVVGTAAGIKRSINLRRKENQSDEEPESQ